MQHIGCNVTWNVQFEWNYDGGLVTKQIIQISKLFFCSVSWL